MELFGRVAEKEIPNNSSTQQQRHLQALVVLDLDAVEIRFHDGHLLQPREERHRNIRLLALLRLLARRVGRLSRHVACHVLAQSALFPPHKVDSWGIHIRSWVGLGAVEVRVARHPEGDLRYAKLPADGAAPFGCLMPDYDLRVGVV